MSVEGWLSSLHTQHPATRLWAYRLYILLSAHTQQALQVVAVFVAGTDAGDDNVAVLGGDGNAGWDQQPDVVRARCVFDSILAGAGS